VYGKVIFISGPSRPRGPFEGLGQWYLDGRYQMAPRTATYLLEDQAVINEITQGGDGPSKPRGPFEGLGHLRGIYSRLGRETMREGGKVALRGAIA